ncbi:unnamed protein product [Urochloa humidicola]
MPAMAEEVVVPPAAAPAEPHILVVTYPAQGHINPARHLALRLLRATGARVTVSTAVSAFRKMFPDANLEDAAASAEGHRDAAGVWHAPYSDGYDGGFDRAVHDATQYMGQVKLVGSRTLAAVMARLRGAGRPVTLAVYTLLLSWVADVARAHAVPAALYWIQPASVLAAYLHFFRGTGGVDKAIAAAAAAGDPSALGAVPGLPPPLRIRDLPSFITATGGDDDPYAFVSDMFRELVDTLGDRPTSVLANTFDAMEPEAVASLREHGVDVIPVGPVLSFLDGGAAAKANDLFRPDGEGYLEWLDAQAPGSVVYISFGSMSVMSQRQIQEVARGMAESGRPFLWVLREDNRAGDDDSAAAAAAALGGERGVVVGWCDQVAVLRHRAVGCFVTHCGWNSTLESVACGVPVVGVPQWTDQGTNAWLVERLGVGVRAAVSEKDGVLEAAELGRCLGFAGSEMVRAKAALWREKARAAAAEGGSSERNLREFVNKHLLAGGGGN